MTALVQTDKEQAFPITAFDHLMDVVAGDLAEGGVDPPQYLASYQEIRGGGDEGLVTNMEQLRRRNRRSHVRENNAIVELARSGCSWIK